MVEIKITNGQETKDKAKAFDKLEDACKYLDSLKKKDANVLSVTHFG